MQRWGPEPCGFAAPGSRRAADVASVGLVVRCISTCASVSSSTASAIPRSFASKIPTRATSNVSSDLASIAQQPGRGRSSYLSCRSSALVVTLIFDARY
jgi:hypothetical protein